MRFIRILSLFCLLSLSACSLSRNVHVQGSDLIESTYQNSKILEWESIFSLGNLRLPESVFPILTSNHVEIGELTLQKLSDGTNRISLKIDHILAQKHFPLKPLTLPNGQLFSEKSLTSKNEQISSYQKINDPALEQGLKLLQNHKQEQAHFKIQGKDQVSAPPLTALEIPILDHSKLYLSTNTDGSSLAGIALNIPAFDRILSKYRPQNPVESIDFHFSKIHGFVGIYTSKSSGQNGIFLITQKSGNASNQIAARSPASQNLSSANLNFSSKPVSEVQSVLNLISQFRLNYLLSRNLTVRIK